MYIYLNVAAFCVFCVFQHVELKIMYLLVKMYFKSITLHFWLKQNVRFKSNTLKYVSL